jgi:hypothetical protein
MISMSEPSQNAQGDGPFGRGSDRDECQPQLAAAQRELGAFTAAVRELYGAIAAADAANYWIDLMETIDLPVVPDCRDWRMLTIQAASRLAMNAAGRLSAEMPMEGTQPQ